MDPDQLDNFITSVCKSGENLAFASLVELSDSPISLDFSSHKGMGIVRKTTNRVLGSEHLLAQSLRQFDSYFIDYKIVFCNIVNSTNNAEFRELWTHNLVNRAKNEYSSMWSLTGSDLYRVIPNKDLRLNLTLDLQRSEIVEINGFGDFKFGIERALRSSMERSNKLNYFETAGHLIIETE